jgi:hypothetical protein
MTYLDSFVGLIVLVTFGLFIWSKFTQQSMKELLGEIRDMLANNDEEVPKK